MKEWTWKERCKFYTTCDVRVINIMQKILSKTEFRNKDGLYNLSPILEEQIARIINEELLSNKE